MKHKRNTLIYWALFLGAISIGCKSDDSVDNQLPSSVLPALQAYEADKSQVNGQKLLGAIYQSAQKDPSASESLFESGIKYADELNAVSFKAASLNSLIKDFYDSEKTPDRIATLANILHKDMKQINSSLALKRGYIEAFPNGPMTPKFAEELPAHAQNVDTFIYHVGNRIIDMETRAFKPELAREYVNVSEGLILANPNFEKGADYLFNAAKTANTIRDHSKSLALYDWLIKLYPEHKLAAKSLFMKAFTYDTELKNTDDAKSLYEQFIEKFPNDDLAKDARFLLDNLGLSEEELLNKIQANQKK